jgi:cytidylate kinase
MGFQIAIDGPVAAGKSTLAQSLSRQLNLVYLDTGAMYRAVAYKAKLSHIDWQDQTSIARLVSDIDLKLVKPHPTRSSNLNTQLLLDGHNVSDTIRTHNIGEGASIVSTYTQVRTKLVRLQQQLASKLDVVMEGRDIGTRVLPHAHLKIFLTADLQQRVQRKYDFHRLMGHPVTLTQIKSNVISRDTRETTRNLDPLKPASDAWILDSTHLNIDQVTSLIVEKVKTIDHPFVHLLTKPTPKNNPTLAQ